MKLAAVRPLDALSNEASPCFAAVFCTFSFDPAFFEEHVLRTVLRLGADPDEHPARYHEEARRALQTTHVACLVDAGMRQQNPGHRLPYDLLDVHARVFHPKLTLLVYESFARLVVGSGNLTRGGYGGNAELFFAKDLAFNDGGAVAILVGVAAFLDRVAESTNHRGTQLALALAELRRRLAATPDDAPPFAFLETTRGALLGQVRGLLPDDAKIRRVGILAPFFERDDEELRAPDAWTSVLGSLLAGSRDVPLDIGVLWDDPPIGVETQRGSLESSVGRLWAWREDDDGVPAIHYFTLRGVTAKQLDIIDDSGRAARRARAAAESALQTCRLYTVGTIRAFAPKNILMGLAREVPLSLWLHPAWRYEEGRPSHRPLHAKLLLVTVARRRETWTLVVLGSPNASRPAMLLDVAGGGNFECAVAFRLDGEVGLRELCPELVACDPALVAFEERTFAGAPPNLALWIESAVHDAATSTLTVTWSQEGPAPLGPWALRYLEDELARGDGAPGAPSVVDRFLLKSGSCELLLVAAGAEYTIPITVASLADLPVNPALADLSLRELLALLGKRIGGERVGTLHAQRGVDGMAPVLEAIFGEGFGPTDVFRVWWTMADELGDPALTLAGFKLRLDGALGLGAVWQRMLGAVVAGAPGIDGLSPDEAWFYGAELFRTLVAIEVPEDPARVDKQAVLAVFLDDLRGALARLAPDSSRAPWLARVFQHYDLPPSTPAGTEVAR